MKKRRYQDWVDLHWQGALSDEERDSFEAYLSSHPELASEWEWDAAILRGLRSLDEVSPSPKFTSRVMCQLDADYQAASSAEVADRHGSGLLKVWFAPQGKALVRVAGIAALVTICVTAWRWGSGSERLATELIQMGDVQKLPDVEALQDFDAIQGLAQASVDVDWELILAMDETF